MKKKALLVLMALIVMILSILGLVACFGDDGGDDLVEKPDAKYTVTFMAEGITVGTQTYTEKNKDITEPAVPNKDGYTGVWEEYELTKGDITVNAVYTAIEYTVTFVADGVTVDTVTNTVEDKDITEPEVPNKDGYTGAWEEYELTTGDITVNAVYTAIEYTLTFVADGVTVGTATYTVEDKDITEPEVPNKVGYKGVWEEYELTRADITVNAVYTAIEYTVTFVADGVTVGSDTYTIEDKDITEPEVPNKDGYTGVWEEYELTKGDITVNAVYTAIEYTVTFVADGKTVGTANYTVEDKEITAPEVPSKDYYTGEWEEYELTTGDITVNAVYTAIEYTVTFVADGVTVSTANYTVEDKDITEPAVPKKAGYTDAWEEYELTTGDKTVNAVYTAIEYTVTFVADRVTIGTDTYTVEDKDITEPAVPNKDYYTAAWEEYELTIGDKTVNAVYIAIEYTVTFVADGKTVDTVTYTVEDKDITEPTVPNKVGYTDAWEEYELTTGDITVNAVYTAIEYTVTFVADGETVGTATYTVEDKKITAPDVPNKDYYTSAWEKYELTKGDITVNAVYIAIEFTVRFVADGETVGTATYTVEDKEITAPEVPNKDGYKGMWEEYELVPGVEITVNAVYIEIFTVTFMADDVVVGTCTYTADNKEITEPNVPIVEGYEGEWEEYELNTEDITVNALYSTEGATKGLIYEFENNAYTVTAYNGIEKNVLIPTIYRNFSVTIIGDYAFSGCSSLVSIEISNSVTSIGDYAFSGCSSLVSIEISNSVTSIGDSAFSYCSSLESIEIPTSVTSIGSNAFRGCSRLERITIPYVGATLGGTSDRHFGYIFGASGYKDNSKYVPSTLKTVIITGGESIGTSAFYGCNSLASIEIPNSVTSIGSSAFRGCSSLTSIEIPNSVTSIGEEAFYGCSSLASVVIGNGVTDIGNQAFRDCSNLEGVYIEDITAWCKIDFSVYIIDNVLHPSNPLLYAERLYINNELATEIVIPNTVTSIGSYAFYGCSSIESIEIPSSVTSIGSSAFYDCDKIIQKENGVHYVDKWVIDCDTSLTNITLGANTVGIGSSAFYGCSRLESIEIPNSVTSIGYNAFEGCNGLTISCESVSKPSGWHSNWNYLGYNNDCPVIWDYKNNELAEDGSKIYTAENGIRYALKEGKAIVIGQSISISGAIEIPSTITHMSNEYIVTSIGEYAFYNCSSLGSIEIPDSVTNIDSYAFLGCDKLIQKENGVHYVNKWVIDCYTSVTNITLRANTVGIGERAFSGCNSLASIEIPNSVTSIGDWAFSGCNSLASIEIPNSVTSIGDWAFFDCSSLTSIEIPNSVTSIGDWAFSRCSSLTSIEIPNSVTSIGEEAFEGCSSLASIEIPSSVTSIGEEAFEGCSSLASIEIPSSVTSIGSSAFWGCSSLINIEYNGTIAEWKAIEKGSDWNNNTGAYTVTCSDGTLTKAESSKK